MTDRLAEIKERIEKAHVKGHASAVLDDIEWLITKVERLLEENETFRGGLNDFSRYLQTAQKKIMEMEAQHARDLKNIVTEKEIRP